MSPKCLVIDARMLFSSGIGTVVQNTLKRLPAQKWTYRVLVANDAGAAWVREHLPKAEIRLVPIPIYTIAEQWSVPQASQGGDIFWSPHYNFPLLFSGALVTTIHDVLPLARPEFFPGWLKQGYARFFLAMAGLRRQRIVCVSEFTACEITRLGGIPPSRLTVIHNGVDEAWFEPLPQEPQPPTAPYFIYAGNVKPHKNLLRLLKAFAQVMHLFPHQLSLVGKRDGFLTGDPAVERFAEKLGDRVSFTDWVGQDELKRRMAKATALIFPSLYEGFGLPAIEAMACGCPVLASHAPALPEVCGEAALFFDPTSEESIGQALVRASKWSDEERSRLIALGKIRASSYSWDESVRRLVKVFEEVSA